MQAEDHRKIGIEQKLFFFDDYSPGSPFWMKNGVRIYNKLQNYIRNKYEELGFEEVMTPVIAKEELWWKSGHFPKYKDNMFCFCHENTNWAMKAMNCPMHALIFKHTARSYKELPLRFADFGHLHRAELLGTLTGLTRVRAFRQDDAHSFCRMSQIQEEIKFNLDFMKQVYSVFGFSFSMCLSTRPEKSIGSDEVWEQAEKALRKALKGSAYDVEEGGGAFYGPKIDIHLLDSYGRKHQCATVQLDFNIPERFELEYINEHDKPERPVMVHRAIYGSFERFFAVLCEHYKGNWPFWLNHSQVRIIPINGECLDYSKDVFERIRKGIFCRY